MSGPYDITFELGHEPQNRADVPEDWGDEIPFDGAVVPGSDAAAMDAELMDYEEWRRIHGNSNGVCWSCDDQDAACAVCIPQEETSVTIS